MTVCTQIPASVKTTLIVFTQTIDTCRCRPKTRLLISRNGSHAGSFLDIKNKLRTTISPGLPIPSKLNRKASMVPRCNEDEVPVEKPDRDGCHSEINNRSSIHRD